MIAEVSDEFWRGLWGSLGESLDVSLGECLRCTVGLRAAVKFNEKARQINTFASKSHICKPGPISPREPGGISGAGFATSG